MRSSGAARNSSFSVPRGRRVNRNDYGQRLGEDPNHPIGRPTPRRPPRNSYRHRQHHQVPTYSGNKDDYDETVSSDDCVEPDTYPTREEVPVPTRLPSAVEIEEFCPTFKIPDDEDLAARHEGSLYFSAARKPYLLRADAMIREKVDAVINSYPNINLFRKDIKRGYSAYIDTESFSLCPPVPVLRDDMDKLRPVIIEGCGVCSIFDPKFAPLWETPTKSMTFDKSKTLKLRPIIDVAVRFILLGHKVTILLPEYYENSNYLEPKVDDNNDFLQLCMMKLVSFYDAQPGPGEKTLLDVFKAEVDKVQGLWIGSIEKQMRTVDRSVRTKEDILSEKQRDPLKTASMRMLTPSFALRSGDDDKYCMTLSFECSNRMEYIDDKGLSGKSIRYGIPEEINLKYSRYTLSDNETGGWINPEPESLQDEQQLYIEAQCIQLNVLKEMIPLNRKEIRGIQALNYLRFRSMVEERKRVYLKQQEDQLALSTLLDGDDFINTKMDNMSLI